MDSPDVLDALRHAVPGGRVEPAPATDMPTLYVDRDDLIRVCTVLKADPGLQFSFLADVTAADYYPSQPRFEVVYHLYSTRWNHRVRLKARVPEDDPRIPSVTGVWRGANWLERETWDLYGIRFDGHPDLRRIYLYESFEGHPLRKDYPKERRQPLVSRADVEPAQARRREERERERYGRWQ